jgi:hypothetical protein
MAKTPFLIVAAFVLGLGGTATAAATITGAQIKNGTVTTKDVKDRSLTAKDLAPGTIPAGGGGTPGPAGPQGPVGPQGPAGPQGAPATDVPVPVLRAEGIASNCDDVVQSLPNAGGGVKLYWKREVLDTGDFLSPSCPGQSDLFAWETGVYLVTASIEWPAATESGRRTLGIKRANQQFLAADSRTNVTGGPTQQSVSTLVRLTEGAAVQVWAFHTAPEALTVNSALSTSNVTMSWVSP